MNVLSNSDPARIDNTIVYGIGCGRVDNSALAGREIMKIRAYSLLASTLLASTALTAPVLAQGEGATATANTDDVIVVTAQRREQNILEVPISVTAIGGEEIKERNAEQLRDLQFAVPGLFVSDRGPGQAQIQLRGVSQFVGAPTVGTYLDELSIAPASTGSALSPQLVDLERIEVLRGPQPALYGESSMGGTIRYITANPDLSEASLSLDGQVAGTVDGDPFYRGVGVVNAPLIQDVLAIRVAGAFEHANGWINTPDGDNFNDVETSFVRGKVLFQPTDAFSASLVGLYQNAEETDSQFANEDRFNPLPARGQSKDEFTIFNLIGTYDFGPVTLLSSTGYIDRETVNGIDQSAFLVGFSTVPLIFGGLGLMPGDITEAVVFSTGDFKRWSQELRLTSNSDGPFTYLIGANYINDETISASFSETSPTPTSALLFDLFGTGPNTNTSEFWTVYGQAGYQFTENLEFSFGARYFEDTRASPFGTEDTFDSFNPKFTLSYSLGDGTIYASAAKGFRSGGFNAPPPPGTPAGPTSFGPETIWTYEIGAKKQLTDILLVDVAVYYNDWSDIQQSSLPVNGVPVRFTINGGKASGFGVDFGAQLRPSEFLTLTSTVGWNNNEYDTASATHNVGDPLSLVPQWTASASADYRRPISTSADFFGRIDFGYTSRSQNTARNLPAVFGNQISFTDSRVLLNARLGVQFERYELYLYGENLTDDNAVIFPSVGTISVPARARPLTAGIGFGIDF